MGRYYGRQKEEWRRHWVSGGWEINKSRLSFYVLCFIERRRIEGNFNKTYSYQTEGDLTIQTSEGNNSRLENWKIETGAIKKMQIEGILEMENLGKQTGIKLQI